MSERMDAPALQLLSEVIELLGPRDREETDTWSGKRTHRRSNVLLPLRLRLLDENDTPAGPAFTARSRDICDRGLGITIPYPVRLLQPCQVELFTDMGAWVGRMRTIHCTQTVGGYKVGLESLDAPPPQPAAGAPAAEETEPEGEPLTLPQAQEEVRNALRGYYRARYSWGLLGVSMDAQISRVIDALPLPPDSEIRTDPRRTDYRREVQGQVHLLVLSSEGPVLLTTDIADISESGARLVVSADEAKTLPAQIGVATSSQDRIPAVVGLWTQLSGTVWVPAHVAHCEHVENANVSVGVHFVMVDDWREFC